MCTTCVTGWRHIGQMRPFFLKQRWAHAKQMPPWPHSRSTASRCPSKQIQQSESEASPLSSSSASASPSEGSTAMSVALHAAAPHAAALIATLMPRSVLLCGGSASAGGGSGAGAAAGDGASCCRGGESGSSCDGVDVQQAPHASAQAAAARCCLSATKRCSFDLISVGTPSPAACTLPLPRRGFGCGWEGRCCARTHASISSCSASYSESSIAGGGAAASVAAPPASSSNDATVCSSASASTHAASGASRSEMASSVSAGGGCCCCSGAVPTM
mmetsp:Transcript_48618/g.116997  ORF Transcript_48618/g.116997 Transcript_48618/m.116997 type:complete len:274 (+) Transcript_48618:124-945(+)